MKKEWKITVFFSVVLAALLLFAGCGREVRDPEGFEAKYANASFPSSLEAVKTMLTDVKNAALSVIGTFCEGEKWEKEEFDGYTVMHYDASLFGGSALIDAASFFPDGVATDFYLDWYPETTEGLRDLFFLFFKEMNELYGLPERCAIDFEEMTLTDFLLYAQNEEGEDFFALSEWKIGETLTGMLMFGSGGTTEEGETEGYLGVAFGLRESAE